MQEQSLPAPATAESSPAPGIEVISKGDLVEQAPNTPKSREVAPVRGDSINQAGNQSGPVQQYSPVDLPQPIVVDPQDGSSSNSVQLNAPAVADDVDVIEKVWVEKAKSIVKQTKDDPYLQEQQVSDLQENYQKKRFGKGHKT